MVINVRNSKSVMSIQEIIVEKLGSLPLEKQQEVLDFVEFLEAKTLKTELPSEDGAPEVSVLTLAQKFIGCVEGPGDLSTNKEYLKGFGL